MQCPILNETIREKCFLMKNLMQVLASASDSVTVCLDTPQSKNAYLCLFAGTASLNSPIACA
jgi:hypothetical protein